MKHFDLVCLTHLACAAALGLGCARGTGGQAAEPIPPPPLDEDVLALVPFGVDAVVWGNGSGLRRTALWGHFESLFGAEDGGVPEELEALRPLFDADEAVFAFAAGLEGSGTPDRIMAVLKGGFEAQSMLKVLAGDEPSTETDVGGFRGIETEGAVAIVLTDRTLIVGPRLLVERAVALTRGEGRSIREDESFTRMRLEDPTLLTLEYRRGAGAPDFTRYGAPPPAISVELLRAVSARIARAGEQASEQSEGLAFSATVTVETELDAKRMVREIERTRRQFAGNMLAKLIGVDWLIDRLKTGREGALVRLSLELSASDVAEIGLLLRRLKKIREVLDGVDGAPGGGLLELPRETDGEAPR